MDVLGILSEPDSGIVAEELAELLGEQHTQELDRGRVLLRLQPWRRRENAHQLGNPVRRPRPRVPQNAAQALEIGVVTVDELDLDLGERSGGSPCVEHGHRVERDVRDRPSVVGHANPDRRVRRVATGASRSWRT